MIIQIQLIARDHHNMNLLEHSHPELKVLNIQFFPYFVKQSNKVNNKIRKAESLGKFMLGFGL